MTKRTVIVPGVVSFGVAVVLSALAAHRAFAQPVSKTTTKPAKAAPTVEKVQRAVAPPLPKVDPHPSTPPPETIEFGACTVVKGSAAGQYQLATTLTNRTKSPISIQAGQPMASLSRTHWQAPWTAREDVRAPAGGTYFAPNATISILTAPAVLAPGAYTLSWLGTNQQRVGGLLPQKTCEAVIADAPAQSEALPDLAITSVNVSPASGTPATAFTFTVTIKNIGHAATGPANVNTGARVSCLLDAVQLGETTYLANMQPNATVTTTRSRPAGIVPWTQPHHITCTADGVPPRVTEEREDNNQVSVPFLVQ